MPALEDHTGLERQTIDAYQRRSFINVSNTKQQYTAFPAIQRNMKIAKKKGYDELNFGLPVEVKSEGGQEFKWNAQVTKNNNVSPVSADDPINISKKDHQIQLAVPKRLIRGHWSYERWEMAANRGKEKIVSMMTSRRLGNDQDMADWFENWFWDSAPLSTDKLTPFNLRYWCYTEPESSQGSYSAYTSILDGTEHKNNLALNHNNFSSGPGGVSRVTYPQLANGNVQYTAFTDLDCVDKITSLMLYSNFVQPVEFPDMVKGAPQRGMYTTSAVKKVAARLARQQNDANASDLVARFTESEIMRTPMYWVPQLDTAEFSLYGSSNKDVIYGLDWSTWWWATVSGFNFEEHLFPPSREAPLHYTHAQYLGGQLCCIDPRSNWVASN